VGFELFAKSDKMREVVLAFEIEVRWRLFGPGLKGERGSC
jgi:hypothetical protein